MKNDKYCINLLNVIHVVNNSIHILDIELKVQFEIKRYNSYKNT